MQYWKLFTNNSDKMAPRVQTHLKFDEKVKVIPLYAEDSSLNFRKFTEKVKFRLNSRIVDEIKKNAKNKFKVLLSSFFFHIVII